MDHILIQDIQAYSKIGLYEHEKTYGQSLNIDLDLGLDLEQAGESGKVEDTIDYTEVVVAVRELAQKQEYKLVENLAITICRELFKRFKLLQSLEVEISKPIVNSKHFSGTPVILIHRDREWFSARDFN